MTGQDWLLILLDTIIALGVVASAIYAGKSVKALVDQNKRLEKELEFEKKEKWVSNKLYIEWGSDPRKKNTSRVYESCRNMGGLAREVKVCFYHFGATAYGNALLSQGVTIPTQASFHITLPFGSDENLTKAQKDGFALGVQYKDVFDEIHHAFFGIHPEEKHGNGWTPLLFLEGQGPMPRTPPDPAQEQILKNTQN